MICYEFRVPDSLLDCTTMSNLASKLLIVSSYRTVSKLGAYISLAKAHFMELLRSGDVLIVNAYLLTIKNWVISDYPLHILEITRLQF